MTEEAVRKTLRGLTAAINNAGGVTSMVLQIVRSITADLGDILIEHDRRLTELERKAEGK